MQGPAEAHSKDPNTDRPTPVQVHAASEQHEGRTENERPTEVGRGRYLCGDN